MCLISGINMCVLLLISMLWHKQVIFESKGNKLSSSAKCRIKIQSLWNRIFSRLNARWQTDWAIKEQDICVWAQSMGDNDTLYYCLSLA